MIRRLTWLLTRCVLLSRLRGLRGRNECPAKLFIWIYGTGGEREKRILPLDRYLATIAPDHYRAEPLAARMGTACGGLVGASTGVGDDAGEYSVAGALGVGDGAYVVEGEIVYYGTSEGYSYRSLPT